MSDPSDLRVRGGIGGVSARLEEIEQAGHLLREIAEEVADRGRVAAALVADPERRSTAVLSPMTFAQAETALAEVVFGPNGLFAVAARIERLGSAAIVVAGGYRVAETAVSGTLRAAATFTGQVVGGSVGAMMPRLLIGTAAVAVVVTGPDRLSGRSPEVGAVDPARLPEPLRRVGQLTLRLLAEHAGPVEAAVAVLPGVISGLNATALGGPVLAVPIFGSRAGPRTVTEVATGMQRIGAPIGAAIGGTRWFQDGTVTRAQVTPAPPSPSGVRPPSGVAELLDRIPASSSDRSQIHVERVDSTTGSTAGRRWVVAVPGTADWSPVAGSTPFDLTGNLRLMAGARSAGSAAVVMAMQATGVRPDEPVLLVGHSQGGLIVAAVAADPAVRREYSVGHVLTSGAPVASIPVPDDVQVLSIEHTDDPVPRLDGAVNPDRPNWITASAPAPIAELLPDERGHLLPEHRTELYRHTAEHIDRSSDPSLQRWRVELAPFLSPGSRVGWDVEVRRGESP